MFSQMPREGKWTRVEDLAPQARAGTPCAETTHWLHIISATRGPLATAVQEHTWQDDQWDGGWDEGSPSRPEL